MFSLFLSATGEFFSGSAKIREPAVAGAFYPEAPLELRQMIKNYLDQARKIVDGEITGIVAPHAGYPYSGPVAGWAYKQIQGESFSKIIVVAPSHFEFFQGVSVFEGQYYRTPLGDIPVDKETAQQLISHSPLIRFSESGHYHSMFVRGEHSLEVQLPFLQELFGEIRLIPVLMGTQNWETCRQLGEAIYEICKGQRVLLVASSDLSHYHPYETARQMDTQFISFFEKYDYPELLELCHSRRLEACGVGPVATVMYACQLLGSRKAKAVRYATSGDVPQGDKSQVVGYMAGALVN